MSAIPLDLFIGEYGAGEFLARRSRQLATARGVRADDVLAEVCERATDGDPCLLAAPGQEWRRRRDVLAAPGAHDGPGDRLFVLGRAGCAPDVLVAVLGLGGVPEAVAALPVADLGAYRLTAWRWDG